MTLPGAARARRLLRLGPALLAVALIVGISVGSRGMPRDEAFFVPGDPPRYALDGVLLYDLLRAGVWHPAEVVPFAERYYARYPALSLGHHPPGLPASLVPFYAVFGVSIFAGRLAILAFFAIAIALLYRVTYTLYRNERVAGWASILFASSPIVAYLAQRVLSEIPTIAWMLAALLALERFHNKGGLWNYALVAGAVTVTLLYRPTAIYMFPAYLVFMLRDGGHRRLLERRVAMASLLALVLLCGVIAGFLVWSPFNTSVVLDVVRRGVDANALRAMYGAIAGQWPLAIAMAGGTLIAALTRDRRAWRPLVWIASVLACAVYLTGAIDAERYSVLAVPAFCLLAAAPVARARTPVQRSAWAVVLVAVTAHQLQTIWNRDTADTPGYEAAARYVVRQPATPTVLYSASVDSGYFVFFVRKHDPTQRMVILRSDKVLTTSLMKQLAAEDRIAAPEEIVGVLQTYGTRYIVIEDRPSGSLVLDWLRDLVLTDRFVERARFPIGRGGPELRGVSLVVYEYLDATEPAAGAELDLNIMLIGRRVRVPLAELRSP